MTREEAIAKAKSVAESKTIGIGINAAQAQNNYNALLAANQFANNSLGCSVPIPAVDVLVDRLVALGLLKLEEKKSAHDRMMEACRRRELTGATIDRFCEALDLAGLCVVEK